MEKVQQLVQSTLSTLKTPSDENNQANTMSTKKASDFRVGDALHKAYLDDANTNPEEAVYTTSNGAPYPSAYETQRMGENGPLLLQDFHLVDLLSHFDRERIPERVVHANGSGANFHSQDVI